jgi:hypothetical protein
VEVVSVQMFSSRWIVILFTDFSLEINPNIYSIYKSENTFLNFLFGLENI